MAVCRRAKRKDGSFGWLEEYLLASTILDNDLLNLGKWISQASFEGKRRCASAIRSLRNIYVDLDYHSRPRFKGMEPEAVWEVVKARLEAEGIPLPSYAMFTGRGMCLSWLFEEAGVPGRQVRRWRTLVQYLIGRMVEDGDKEVPEDADLLTRRGKVWSGLGLDRACTDPCRVFRIGGTTNEKSKKRVRLLWPADWGMVERHSFEGLCRTLLPFTWEEIQEMRAAKAREAAVQAATGNRTPRGQRTRRELSEGVRRPVTLLTGQTLWQTYLADMLRVHRHLHGEGGRVAEGGRDMFLFHASVAKAWTEGGDRDAWASEFESLLEMDRDFTPRLARTVLGSLERRLRDTQAGITQEWRGHAQGRLYRYRAATLCERLGITGAIARAAGCVALIPDDAEGRAYRRDRLAGKAAARRAARGATPRLMAQAARLATGEEALRLREEGLTVAEVLAAFGCGRTYLMTAMREAREAAPVTLPMAANENGKEREMREKTEGRREGHNPPDIHRDETRTSSMPPLRKAPPAIPAAAPEASPPPPDGWRQVDGRWIGPGMFSWDPPPAPRQPRHYPPRREPVLPAGIVAPDFL